ncbi:AEC family transporter [Paenibacillus sanguinis]|uniref:AEC family transporter n=1 Tax=Paenibacillus sanguinis TaxID=225906 RepID=UPI000363F5B5|nr:AEC family transporter [Paenibacillus sanguinis]
MSLFAAYNEIITLFFIMLIGYAVIKYHIVADTFRKDLSNFLFYVSIPCTMIHSMNQEFSQAKLHDVFMMLGMSVAFLTFGFVLRWVGLKLLGEKDIKRKTVYEFTFIITNYGFMGWPVSYALFGDDGMFYSAIFAIPINIVFYVLGGFIFSKINGDKRGVTWRILLTPPNIATFLGILLFLFSVKVPPIFRGTIDLMSATTTPLAMAVAGMMLASFSLRAVFANRKAFVFASLRLLALPLLFFILLKALGFSGLVLAIPVIIAAMPTPPNLTVLTEQYQADSYLAAQLIFITTLLSVLTLPVIAAIVGFNL